MDYCNFDDVKLRLNITGDDYNYQIADFVTTCSRWVDEYCRLPVDGFAVSNDSTRYFGHGDLSKFCSVTTASIHPPSWRTTH